MKKLYLFSFCLVGMAYSNHNQPLNRPYTQRNSRPFILEQEYHRMIAGDEPMTFIFPRPCISSVDSSNVCGDSAKIRLKSEKNNYLLDAGLAGGIEYRYLKENISAYDAGLILSGYKGPLSYYLDTRMFVETHENPGHKSYDREIIDRQSEDASGTIAYTSYSRHRYNINYDFSWGRISGARDAAHWGPGIYSNLVFHQDAVPFNHLTFTSSLGPLRIMSLYGQLVIDGGEGLRMRKDTRSVYAHRYELSITNNFSFGVSEQLVMYDIENPFAFIPIVPLFIEKGTQVETGNNGILAFDLSYRFRNSLHFYSEFLIDDIISPTSMFDDNWGNKWGWMIGIHGTKKWNIIESGLICEYSRIEPWVYTHTDLSYKTDSSFAQSANQGYPLGNQNGPNSQSLNLKLYLKPAQALYFGFFSRILWKGSDTGSNIDDKISPELQSTPKNFIHNVEKADITISPYAYYRWKWTIFEGKVTFIDDLKALVRLQVQY